MFCESFAILCSHPAQQEEEAQSEAKTKALSKQVRDAFIGGHCTDGVSQEAASKEISLADNPINVEKMIGYLYKLDYSNSPLDCGGQPTLLIDAQVYTIADKYNIHSLKDLALKKFGEMVAKGWENDGFSLAIKEIYTSTPDSDRGLRHIVCFMPRSI